MDVNEEYLKREMDKAHDRWKCYLQKKGNDNFSKAKYYMGYYDGLHYALYTVREPQDERIKKIADHYGFTSQANMLCEESAEYMVALNKLRRGKPEAYANVKEEVADILVMASQLRYLLGADEIDKIISEKLDRQIQRIEAEKEG